VPRAYETMYILRPQLEEEAVDTLIASVGEQIAKFGGQVEKTEKRGRKRLAYEVNDFRDGIYVLSNFSADGKAIAELERFFRLNEDVIRHLVVRSEA